MQIIADWATASRGGIGEAMEETPPEDLGKVTPQAGRRALLAVSFGAFFIMGLAGAMATTLVPVVPMVFGLGLSAAMVVQWIALVVSGFSSLVLAQRLQQSGPRAVMLGGLSLVVLGCLVVAMALHPPGGAHASFAALVAALGLVALGIAALQVAANVCAVQAGSTRSAAARLSAAQAFNSIGVLAGVSLGAALALGGEPRSIADGAGEAYLLAGAVSVIVLAGAALVRRKSWASPTPASPAPASLAPIRQALRSRRALAGATAIALYVGAEGTIGSLLIPTLHQPTTLGLSLAAAGQLVAWIFWGGALAGRALGSALLLRVPAPHALGIAAMLALLCMIAVLVLSGPLPGYALLATGLCNSIMFPAIFALTLEHADAPPTAVSGLLSTAIAGGALMSAAAGYVAEHHGLAQAFAVPALAYAVITGFAVWTSGLATAAPPHDSRTTSSIGSRSDFTS